jgi:exodeoxyribonuclease VII large subunit
VDVLIVGRGGGSVEDLWSFNEEVVARAIFHSEIPLVSAVGHETDFTIADFVADQRAPTPSAAAEMVVPDGAALERQVQLQGDRMEAFLQGQLRRWRQRLEFLEKSALFREPRARLAEAAQRLDAEADSLDRAVRDRLGALTRRLENLAASVRAHRPDQVLALRRQQTEAAAARLERALVAALQQRGRQVEQMRQKLVLLSPEGTLERGYSITLAADGTLVRSASKAAVGDMLLTRLRDGRVESTVTAVQSQGGTGEA